VKKTLAASAVLTVAGLLAAACGSSTSAPSTSSSSKPSGSSSSASTAGKLLGCMVPYVATIIAVAGLVGQVRPPAADGQPYITS
jgi:ABC-type uncharacterized transport system permease subunit